MALLSAAAAIHLAATVETRAERYVWTGAGVSNQASMEANWEGGAGPTNLQGSDLVFGPLDDASRTKVSIDVPGIPDSVTFEDGAPPLTFVKEGQENSGFLALMGRHATSSLVNQSGQPQTFKIQMHQLWVRGIPVRKWEASRGELIFDQVVFARGDGTQDINYMWEWVAESAIDFRGGVRAIGSWGSGSALQVEKHGPEPASLDRESKWNGSLAVCSGPLIVNGTITLTGELSVATAGTLAGSGTISAPVSVQGVLSPGGETSARMTFDQGLVLAGTLEIDLGTKTDLLSVSGAPLVLGGRLIVRPGKADFSPGTVFKVFEFPDGGAPQGEFSSVELPPLPGGLTWQNNLAQDGTLVVAP